MSERFLEARTCQDRCGIQKTDERHEGAPVYRCPGCGSRWYRTSEFPQQPDASIGRRVVDRLARRASGRR